MDTAAKLIICVILGAFYAPTVSAYEFTDPYPNVRVIDGDLHIQRPGGGTTLAYPNAGISKEIPVNTSKGNYLVPVEKTLPISSAKVGKAATRFVRSLPLIATGLAIYDTLCDIGEICTSSNSGQLEAFLDPLETGYPLQTGYGRWLGWGSSYYPTPELACSDPQRLLNNIGAGAVYDHIEQINASNYRCYGKLGSNVYYASNTTYYAGTCPEGYQLDSGSCKLINSTRPPTESDWTKSETKLNAQPEQTATALYNSDAPIPVIASTQSAPVTQQIAQTSTQTKDPLGNITGTQVTTTSVKVEDTSTTNNVTYNVTEVTTITTYNENNEITNTQTSTSDNSPPKTGTDETTISFDDVPPAQLEEETPEFNLQTPVSWGEGTCPADVDLGIYDLKISYAPACDAADMLRPIFLLLASVTAMFIVAGVSRNKD